MLRFKNVFKHWGLIWLIIVSTAQCTKNEDPVLDRTALNGLFSSFSPVYNYVNEETRMLAHAARVSVPGCKAWEATRGTTDSLGLTEINTSSMFRIGSATKMFTATVILQLWEEGLIDLDKPFNEYLALDEGTCTKINAFSTVTIRHLLSHRSGVSRISSTTFFDFYDYTDSVSQMERMHFLFSDCDPEFAPGTQYGYRNSNFNVLGFVIEKVTGKDYQQVLKERIWDPLGLANTHLLDYDIQENDTRIARGYTLGFDGCDYHGSQAWAAGGLVSTVEDLSKFLRALMDGDLFQHPSTIDLMVTPVASSPYGLGMFITQGPQGLSYGHGGGIFGYNTRLEYFPEFAAIIVSTMSFNGYDFMVANWYENFCFPVMEEVRKVFH